MPMTLLNKLRMKTNSTSINPFVSIVGGLSIDEEKTVDIPYLNWIGGMLEDNNILPGTYADILSVLEFLHRSNALELTKYQDGTITVKGKTYG